MSVAVGVCVCSHPAMGEFRVHQVRFYEYKPQAVHCLVYEELSQKLALSRSDGSIEIWSAEDNWYQESILCPAEDQSVESLVWCGPRLFSAGLHGNLQEHDLLTLTTKSTTSSNNGAIWCLTLNEEKTIIAAGTEDGCVVLFAVTPEGATYERSLQKQEGRILCIAWYSPENLIVTGGIDNIRVWNVEQGHAIQRLTLGRQERQKETIVWTVGVTKDFTIVSGDSRGKTIFWNGRHGTQIKSFQSHKADVLTLAVNKEGTAVYSSGIDPYLIQFEFISSNPNSDLKMWVKSSARAQHTHDVRSITFADSALISGGVDCQIIVNHLTGKTDKGKFLRISPIPQAPLCYTATKANAVLLRYPDYLELWRLGSTSRTSEQNGEILPLNSSPIKLLQLRSRNGEYIVCSAISQDATWIAYSCHSGLRVFRLNIEEIPVASPRISVVPLRNLSKDEPPAHCLAFMPGNKYLVSATNKGTVQVLHLHPSEPNLSAVETVVPPSGSDVGIHLLAVSTNGKYIATGDHGNKVHVYQLNDTERLEHKCSLPKYSHQPTAIAFHPSHPELCVAYCNRKLVEFNVEYKEYTVWSKQLQNNWHWQWLRRYNKLMRIIYHPTRPHQIFLQEDSSVYIIDKTQPLPTAKDKIYKHKLVNKDESHPHVEHAFHVCSKFKYVLHMDILDDDFLLLVERPPLAILDTLPQTLKQKKFGT